VSVLTVGLGPCYMGLQFTLLKYCRKTWSFFYCFLAAIDEVCCHIWWLL